MFLILLRYVKPIEEIDAVRPQHLEFLDRGFAEGKYVLAGRRVPPEGGVIVARGTDEEEVRRLAEADPYIRNGLAAYELIRFHAGRTQAGLTGDDPV